MLIPNKIKIGIHTVEIKRVELTESDADQNGGWADWENNIICIAKGMPESREAEIFLHEIEHFINIYKPEIQVTSDSGMLLQIIRDNNLDFRKIKKHKI